jgi:Ca2+-binding EF-hand superfamily protein
MIFYPKYFSVFDKDRNGYVSAKEIKKVMQSLLKTSIQYTWLIKQFLGSNLSGDGHQS